MLLTEGASTSAREVVTTLGLAGHEIEVCDPNWYCLSRYSVFVSRFHHCPPMSKDPEGYLAFVLGLLETRRFDVLLPIHEQGLVFAKVAHLLPPGIGVALPSFEAYWTAVDKVRFSRLLDELDVPQPPTRIVGGFAEIPGDLPFPFLIKRSMSTASRGVKRIGSARDFETAWAEIGDEPGELLIQNVVDGPLEHAQAVFDHGRFVAMHGYRQIVPGVGGGEAVKESVYRPDVREFVERIAERLAWHGALSFDYLLDGDTPRFVDCNPRLVEPFSAHLAGTDLTGLLLRVSQGESPPEAPPGKVGLRTHIAMQALFGIALRTGSRTRAGRGPPAASRDAARSLAASSRAARPPAAVAIASEIRKSGWTARPSPASEAGVSASALLARSGPAVRTATSSPAAFEKRQTPASGR